MTLVQRHGAQSSHRSCQVPGLRIRSALSCSSSFQFVDGAWVIPQSSLFKPQYQRRGKRRGGTVNQPARIPYSTHDRQLRILRKPQEKKGWFEGRLFAEVSCAMRLPHNARRRRRFQFLLPLALCGKFVPGREQLPYMAFSER